MDSNERRWWRAVPGFLGTSRPGAKLHILYVPHCLDQSSLEKPHAHEKSRTRSISRGLLSCSPRIRPVCAVQRRKNSSIKRRNLQARDGGCPNRSVRTESEQVD